MSDFSAITSRLLDMEEELERLKDKYRIVHSALIESLKLQAHYATLLNMHDDGRRMVFVDVESWIERLQKTKTNE